MSAPITPSAEPIWYYSATQRTKRIDDANGKRFLPQHLAGSRWVTGGGTAPWPFYGKLPETPGTVIEVEGEKCADILLAMSQAAITHPGHNHTVEASQARYSNIKERITRVVYIADNDEKGKRRAEVSQKAAAAAGVPFIALYAEQLWPGIVDTGSVDDVPTAEIIPAITAALAGPQPRPTAAQLDKPAADAFRRDIKQHLDESNSNSGADFQVFVTDKAIEHNLTSYQAEAIIRELRKDDDVTTEADAGIAKVKADIAAWEYRRNELKLDILLPKALHAPIRFVMESIPGSDELSAGMAYLGCMSGVLKTGTLIRADYRSFVVPPSLYLAFIGKSGLGKSPTIREIGMRSLDLVQRHYSEINRQRLQEWEAANAGVKRSEQAEKPKPVLMTMADYTGEFLGSLLATHEPLQLGHLISCDELSQVFRSLNAYKTAGKGGEEQQLLSLFDGRGSATGRITTGISHFDYAQFSIIGGLQPRVFDQLAASGDPGGLYARMLMVKCDETNVLRDPVEPPETIARYRQQLDVMQDVALKASLLQPKQYMLSDDAMRQLAQIAFDSREHARKTDLDEHSSIYGKRATQVIRLAGLTHIACVAAGELPPDSKISAVAIRNAFDVVAHLHEYALDAQARAHDTGADAWLVESILRNADGRPLTAAKYHGQYLTKSKKSLYSVAVIDKIMHDLAAQGLGLIVPSSSRRKTDGALFVAAPLKH